MGYEALEGDGPSSRTVLGELHVLRGRDGITHAKLRNHCLAIMSLPVTLSELTDRGLSGEDRHVAAYEAIRCTVQHLVKQDQYARILWVTLNYEGLVERDLDGRRDVLMSEFSITSKQLRRVESDAYDYLAARLVTLAKSPCSAELDRVRINVIVEGDTANLQRSIRRLLELLSTEDRPAARDGVSDTLLSLLPNARLALIEDEMPDSGEVSASVVIAAVLGRAWQDAEKGVLGREVVQSLLGMPVLHRTAPLTRMQALIDQAARSVGVSYLRRAWRDRKIRRNTSKSLEVLAYKIAALERSSSWQTLL